MGCFFLKSKSKSFNKHLPLFLFHTHNRILFKIKMWRISTKNNMIKSENFSFFAPFLSSPNHMNKERFSIIHIKKNSSSEVAVGHFKTCIYLFIYLLFPRNLCFLSNTKRWWWLTSCILFLRYYTLLIFFHPFYHTVYCFWRCHYSFLHHDNNFCNIFHFCFKSSLFITMISFIIMIHDGTW